MRSVLDSAAQFRFIKTEAANFLGLKKEKKIALS